MKTLKQIQEEKLKPYLHTHKGCGDLIFPDISHNKQKEIALEAVKEWLTQKRQDKQKLKPLSTMEDFLTIQNKVYDELLEELNSS